ncbi:MAG: hypothetical protein V1729_02835 [Candidatus Woesearchaeota archaeon]
MGLFSIFGKKQPPFDALLKEDEEHNEKRNKLLHAHFDLIKNLPFSYGLKSTFKTEYSSAMYNIEKIHNSGMPGSVFSLDLSDKLVKKYFESHDYQNRSGENHHFWWNTLYPFTMKFRDNIVRAGILEHFAMEDKRGRQEPAERYALLIIHEKFHAELDKVNDSAKLLVKYLDNLEKLFDKFKTQLYQNKMDHSPLFELAQKYHETLRDQKFEFQEGDRWIEPMLDAKKQVSNISEYDHLASVLRKREKLTIKAYELERKMLEQLKDEYQMSGRMLKAA